MNALMKRLLLSCLFILMIMLSVSCTLGGLGLGAGLDSINNPSVIEGREVTSLDKGEPIKILKYDQSIMEGRYQGVKIIPKVFLYFKNSLSCRYFFTGAGPSFAWIKETLFV